MVPPMRKAPADANRLFAALSPANEPPPGLAGRLDACTRLDPVTGCWEWTGKFQRTASGRTYPSLESVNPRRHAYRYWRGAFPKGHAIVAVCGNDGCIHPHHAGAFSWSELYRFRPRPRSPRRPTAATHCKQGHEFTPASSRVVGGERVTVYTRLCKICSRARRKRYHATAPYTYEPTPPRPDDPYEGDVERIVRRALAPPKAKQIERLIAALDPWPLDAAIPVPAQDGEGFPAYKARTSADQWQYTWWLASRVFGDPRIDAVMKEIMASESMIGGQHDGTGGTGGNSRRGSLHGGKMPVVRTRAGGT